MFGSKDRSSRPSMDIDTLIGARTHIEGSIKFSGGLRIDGSVRGTLVSEGDQKSVLMLSEKGVIEGEVRAPHVVINGTLRGDIVASERVELSTQARVTGNIYYKILEMAAGAEVSGKIVRQEEPRRQLAAPEDQIVDVIEATLDRQQETKIEATLVPKVEAKQAPRTDSKTEKKSDHGLEAKIEPKEKSRMDAKRA